MKERDFDMDNAIEKEDVMIVENEKLITLSDIKNKIYEIRGVQVMLDSDLALLYNTLTKRINEVVKRNKDRFPERFCFQLTIEEYNRCPRSQFATLNKSGNNRGNNLKYLPYAFTEQAVEMLSCFLHSEIAVTRSVQIMDAFVAMRHFIKDNIDVLMTLNSINNRLDNQERELISHEEIILLQNKQIIDNNKKIEKYQKDLAKVLGKINQKEEIYFKNGSYYDAYSTFIDIIKKTKKELIIIDSYADKTILDLIRNTNCKVILITRNSERLSESDISKYNLEYNNLEVIRNNEFHDRFFILDRDTVY